MGVRHGLWGGSLNSGDEAMSVPILYRDATMREMRPTAVLPVECSVREGVRGSFTRTSVCAGKCWR